MELLKSLPDKLFIEMGDMCKRYADAIVSGHELVGITPSLQIAYYSGGADKPSLMVLGINSGFDTAEDRRDTLRYIGANCFQRGYLPQAWFLVCEAWRLEMPADQYSKAVSVSKHPERREVVIFDGVDFDGKRWIHGVREVQRDKNDHMSFSTDWEVESWLTMSASGRSAPLLDALRDGYVVAQRFAEQSN